MLNISKYRKVIVGCSAIATLACTGLVTSDRTIAQTLNNSNASGVNVANPPSPPITTGGGGGGTSPAGGSSPAISGRAGTISARVSAAQATYTQAAATAAQAETAQPVAADTTPVRFAVDKGVADLASCGCPNADTVGTAPTAPAPSPALVAAKAAEADAAAELAAAKAEARQFIESVKNGSTATTSTVASQLW